MDVSHIREAARNLAGELMGGRCKITRPGERVWDEDNAEWITTPVTVYDGKFRLKMPYRAPESANAPGQTEQIQQARLSLPILDSTGIRDNDEAVILEVADGDDPDLVGVKLRVKGQNHQSDASARRLAVEEYS